MATQTKVNPVGGIVLNTLYSTLQIRAFKVVLDTALVAGLGNSADLVAQEIGTTGALFQIATDGEEMVIIGDAHALDVDTLATRIGRIVEGAGTTSGGVYTGTNTNTVTVTALSTLAGLLA